MDTREEFEFAFYRLRNEMGKDRLNSFLQTKFEALEQYDIIWEAWIEQKLLDDDGKICRLFREKGLYDKSLMSNMFLRIFYVFERQNRIDKDTRIR